MILEKGPRSYNISSFVLWLAVITPAMPKVYVSNGVYVYLLEFFLLAFFPFFLVSIKNRVQVALLGFWLLILISTLMSSFAVVDAGGLARVVKGLIYIPLFSLSYNRIDLSWIKIFTTAFVFAGVFNLILLFYNISLYGFNLWDVRTISSGLSNKYFSFVDFSIGTIESGAHGIWGNYCVLAFTLAVFLRIRRAISGPYFVLIATLSIIGIGSSVSREAIITMFAAFFGLMVWGMTSTLRFRMNLFLVRWIIIGGVFIGFVVITWGEHIPIVSKFLYTIESFEASGTEGNVQLRINGWKVFFESLQRNPEKIITGFGFNREYYVSFLGFAESKFFGNYVAIPESFFVMGLSYGGVLALLCSIWFFVEVFKICNSIRDSLLKTLFSFFFLGILIVNSISGASIVSDLFYGQVLIVLGFLYKFKNEDIVGYSPK